MLWRWRLLLVRRVPVEPLVIGQVCPRLRPVLLAVRAPLWWRCQLLFAQHVLVEPLAMERGPPRPRYVLLVCLGNTL